MLVVAFSSRFVTDASVHIGAGWTKLDQADYEGVGNTSVTGAIFYKIASQNNALTITTIGDNVQSSHVSYRVSGAKRISGTSSIGLSAAPNPPSFSPIDGAGNYLWFATAHLRGSVTTDGYPTDYTHLESSTPYAGANGSFTSVAYRSVNAATQDPDEFEATSSTGWVSFTLVLDAGDPDAAAIVREDHIVTTTASVNTLSVIVEDGGTLVVNNDVTMSVANGSVMEIEDGGTLDMLTGSSLINGPGSFDQQSGGKLKIGSNQGIHASSDYGNILVDGTRSYSTGGYYVYQGTSIQDPGSGLPSSVAGLEINNSGFGLLFLVNQEVTDQLTLTQGIIHMGNNVLTVSNDQQGAVSGGSSTSFVSGEMRRAIAGGEGTYAFPVGSKINSIPVKIAVAEDDVDIVPTVAPTYAPVSVTFKAGSSAGILAASTTDGDNSDISNSRLDAEKTVNRSWDVSPTSGLENVSYDISFVWNPNDEDSGFEYENAYLGKEDGGNWIYPLISNLSPTSLTATGLTSFSEFQIGNLNSPLVINGYKFNDLNGNGTWDSNEPGLEGWTIQISGSAGSHTRTTDANGFYAFEDIQPGQYQVREVNQVGWVQSAPGGEGFANVSLTESRQIARVDFGNWKYSTVAGSVYKDLSGEGIRDASSEDFEGVTVVLRNMSNVVIDTQETDASGVYLFEGVAPGHYYITVTSPEGYNQSFPGSASGYNVLVTSGSALDGYEFGLFQPVVLTGYVYLTQAFKSAFGDGQVQDELIPEGITVSGVRTGPAPLKLAYASSSFQFDIPEDGFFYVDNLLPGLYLVQITLPEYYFSVTENPITVQLNANIEIEITFGIQYDVENAPEVATSTISGSVFFDADGSGTWASTEPGAGSQTVNLTGKSQRGDDITLTTTSASDGSYIFNELPAGLYMISVTPSVGMSASWPMTGSLSVKLDQDEDYGGARVAVTAMASAQAGDDASFAGMTLAIDTNLDGTADTRVDVSGKMVATLGGTAGQATRPASIVSFSGMGTDSHGHNVSVSVPGSSSSTGAVTTVSGQSSAELSVGLTVVLDGQVLYAYAPVSLKGGVAGWPFRGVSLSNAGQAPVELRDPFGTVRARIVLAKLAPLHGVDLGVERADFGDAPDSYGTKRATLADPFLVQGGKLVYPGDGARHLMPQMGNPSLMLGTGITAEADGKPSELADADSDDGVVMTGTVSRGGLLDMDITVTGVGKLSAWADWNRDGSFGAGEQILTDIDVDGSLGVYTLSVAVPLGASEGLTFVRFRLTSQAGVGPTGMALDGEVEDYALTVGALASGGDDSGGGGSGGTNTGDDATGDKPTEFRLGQNYPNPFNPTTVIPFELAQTGTVKLAVYDVTGRQVTVLVNASMGAGRHSVTFNAAGIPSGVYMVRMEAGGRIMTSKLTLLK